MWVLKWIEVAPKGCGGCGGCLISLIVIIVIGTIFLEVLLKKDLDNDGKIAYDWTEEVKNSDGIKPNIEYQGVLKLQTTASDKYKETFWLEMTLNEDYTFKAYWTTRPGTLDEREVSGKWDYYVYDDNVYRKLEFERDSFKNPHFTELYVDKDMCVYIYDIYNDEISQEQYFSSEQSVGRFKEKRKRKQ